MDENKTTICNNDEILSQGNMDIKPDYVKIMSQQNQKSKDNDSNSQTQWVQY